MVYIGHMENNTAIRDFFTDTEWDAIFDVIEYKEEWEKEEKFNVESYINSNYDY